MVATEAGRTAGRWDSRRLRIGIVAPPWVAVPPPAYGGTEAVLDGLARGLRAAGHDVVLYTTGDSTCPVSRAWTYGSALGIGVPGTVPEARHVVEAYRHLTGVDVLHDHTVLGPLYAAGTATVPVVTTNHGPFNTDLTPIYRAVDDQVAVVAISRHQASTARDVRIAAVIHHGIDVGAVPVGAGRGGYAAFVGRMNPDKGVHLAIQVARRAGVPLRIAAKMREPVEVAYFEEVVRPLLGPDVELLGEVTAPEKWGLLGGACCLLNPIHWPEPFGMVMIEALAAGTPVVTTSQGAAPEIVEPGVTGAIADDPAGLVRGVLGATGLDRRECRSSAERRFSIERMAADHLALYRSLDARRHAGNRLPSPV